MPADWAAAVISAKFSGNMSTVRHHNTAANASLPRRPKYSRPVKAFLLCIEALLLWHELHGQAFTVKIGSRRATKAAILWVVWTAMIS